MILQMCLKVFADPFHGSVCFVAEISESANKKELVTDLIVKAKQVEYLINSLPEPEPEEEQVWPSVTVSVF
jgi:hypothetical protein